MENKEIMTNEVVEEVAENVADVGSVNGLKVLGGIGLVALVGVAAYEGYKLIKTKYEAKKKSEANKTAIDITDEVDFSEE